MTLRVEVTYQGRLTAEPEYEGEIFDACEELERAFDNTTRELLKLGVMDPIVSGSLTTGEIEITVIGEGNTIPDIIAAIDSAIRSSLHAAGISTKGWKPPKNFHMSANFQKIEIEETAPDDDPDLVGA